jgi:uncharacterized membrane protein
MASGESSLAPGGGRPPADVSAVVVYTALTAGVVFVPGLSATPLRAVLAVPFVLFVPGYVLLGVLFPRASSPDSEDGPDAGLRGGLGPVERVSLSVATSVAAVILLGLGLQLSPWPVALPSVFAGLALVSLVGSGLTVLRRRRLPADRRVSVPLGAWYRRYRDRLVDPPTRVDALLNVVLAASVVFAVWGVGYAAVGPEERSLTEVGLLAEQLDGDLEARGYPTNLSAGASDQVVLALTNREHETVDYSLVVELQPLVATDAGPRLADGRQLRRLSVALEHNETRRLPQNVTVGDPGRYRLNFLVYRETVPDDTTVDNAYREVHLWLNVTSAPD